MKYVYSRTFSVVIKENFVFLYVERPLGFTITPLSLYKIKFDDMEIISPICNGNPVKALRFIVEKNKSNFWVTKLSSKDVIKISAAPVASYIEHKITSQDILICQNKGIGHVLSYLTDERELPAEIHIEMPNLADFFDIPLFVQTMKSKVFFYINGKVSQIQKQMLKQSKINRQVIFGSLKKKLPDFTGDRKAILMVEDSATLSSLRRLNIPYVFVPSSL